MATRPAKPPADASGADHLSSKELFELYESGKHRRYGLLFTINGAAFAVVSLLVDTENNHALVGGLEVWHLALVMAILSIALGWDIWEFGKKMRALAEGSSLKLFQAPGQWLVCILTAALTIGWLVAGFAPGDEPAAATEQSAPTPAPTNP